jgi:hypothetical protein
MVVPMPGGDARVIKHYEDGMDRAIHTVAHLKKCNIHSFDPINPQTKRQILPQTYFDAEILH